MMKSRRSKETIMMIRIKIKYQAGGLLDQLIKKMYIIKNPYHPDIKFKRDLSWLIQQTALQKE
jgi:hypothetical protein